MDSSRRWGVKPRDPLESGQFHRLLGFPGCSAMNELGFVEPVDGFCECVVVAIAFAAHRGFDTRLSQTLAVANRHVLRPAIAMVNQGAVTLRLARVECLFQCIENEVGLHRAADAPANDASGEHVNDEGHVEPALPGRDVGEIRHPKLVRPLGLELPIDPVQWARRFAVADRRAHHLAAHHAAQALPPHQSLDRASRHRHALTHELPPDLVSTVDLKVDHPDALDLRYQSIITLRSGTALQRIALKHPMVSISRRGDLQNLADRLDPVRVTVRVNKVPQDFSRRSSSAWAKNALASFKISLARRSSLTSRSRSFTRCASAVVTPARTPVSTS